MAKMYKVAITPHIGDIVGQRNLRAPVAVFFLANMINTSMAIMINSPPSPNKSRPCVELIGTIHGV